MLVQPLELMPAVKQTLALWDLLDLLDPWDPPVQLALLALTVLQDLKVSEDHKASRAHEETRVLKEPWAFKVRQESAAQEEIKGRKGSPAYRDRRGRRELQLGSVL